LGLVGYVQVTVTVDNFAPAAGVTTPAKIDHVRGGRVFTLNGEVELYVPPNAWPVDQIVRIDSIPAPAGGLPAAAGAGAGATWVAGWLLRASDPTLDKTATLTVRAPGASLGLYRMTVSGTDTTLTRLGGTSGAGAGGGTGGEAAGAITTAIDELGAYVVLAGADAAGAGHAGARELDCQPRVISPRGGGYDTKAAISFELGKAGRGAVKVYDRAGRLVREIAEAGDFPAGRNVVFWDGTDGDGQVVPSGLYTVAVRFDGQTTVRTVAVANR
jgi:hypothetical protein